MQLQPQDEAGSISEKTDICILMEEVTICFASLLEEKNITLSLSCPLNTHLILTSPIVLKDVLYVLLKNMIELSDQNAIIEIVIVQGDLSLHVEFLNRGKMMDVEQLNFFFADEEDVYQKSLHRISELTTKILGGDISYHCSPESGTYWRLKIKADSVI
jgi:hypothetical protein